MSTSDHRHNPDDDRLTFPIVIVTLLIVVLAYSGEWIGPLFR
jgi:hypothetical protein